MNVEYVNRMIVRCSKCQKTVSTATHGIAANTGFCTNKNYMSRKVCLPLADLTCPHHVQIGTTLEEVFACGLAPFHFEALQYQSAKCVSQMALFQAPPSRIHHPPDYQA